MICEFELSSGASDQIALRERFHRLCNDKEPFQVAHRDYVEGFILAKSQPEKCVELILSAASYYQSNDLKVPEWKCRVILARVRNDLQIETAQDALERAFELATDTRSSLLHEKTLMVQRELDLPAVMVDEHNAVISTGKINSEDGYSILKTLGKGAFGVVHHAYDAMRNQDVALKKFDLSRVFDNRRREAVLDNIRRELKATANIDHPGVLKPLAYGNDSQAEPYVVYPLLNGVSLRQWMTSEQNNKQRLKLLSDIAHALAAAHSANVVHRDLKPENIMVLDNNIPVIVDFGIACFEPSETDPANAVGTLPYMSPEHLNGDVAKSPMDIYALGIMSYELLMGERPWGEQCPKSRIRYAIKKFSLNSQMVKLGIDPKLAHLIGRMLAFKSVDRPPAEEVAIALDSFSVSSD